MKNNTSPYVSKMPKYLFWGIIFMMFLPIILLPPSFQPSDYTRSILFRMTLIILSCIFLFKFFYKKDSSFSLPRWKNPTYLIIFVILIFFGVLIVSTVFSQDVRFSVFGSPARSGGILNMLFYIIFAVFLFLFCDESTWDKLIKTNFIVGLVTSAMAVIQYFGLLKNVFVGWEAGGPPSFLGNSTFLAIYMIFMVFSSFVMFLNESIKNRKIYYGIICAVFLLTILITGSRATYLGILAGFIFFLLLYPKKFEKLKVLAVSFLALAVLVVIVFNLYPNIINNTLGKMVADRLSIKVVAEDLAGTRLSAWKITWQAIKEKPLLGWGPENFDIGFEKYFDPTYPPGLGQLWWDRPHNVFLEIWVNSGIFALIFYILFWILLLWQLQKYKRNCENHERIITAHSVQAMLIAYLTALFFNFDNFSTLLISFFFVGYALYLTSSKTERVIVLSPGKYGLIKLAGPIFLIFIIIFLWSYNIKLLYINSQLSLAKNLSISKQCKKSFDIINGQNWENAGILKSYSMLEYSDIIKNCAWFEPEKEVEKVKKAMSLLKISAEIQPKFSRTWLFMGGLTNILAAKEHDLNKKNQLLEEANFYLEKALKLSPKRQEIIVEKAKRYLIGKDYKGIQKEAETCLSIDKEYAPCYWYLGLSQLYLKDYELGKKNIHIADEKRYPVHSTSSLVYLADIYIGKQDYEELSWIYTDLTSLNPDNAQYHASLALIHQKTGDYSAAIYESIKFLKLQPDAKEETENFVNILIQTQPNNTGLYFDLAIFYKEAREYDKAREAMLKYYNLIQGNPETLKRVQKNIDDFLQSLKN